MFLLGVAVSFAAAIAALVCCFVFFINCGFSKLGVTVRS
jgi:hypothetical protein